MAPSGGLACNSAPSASSPETETTPHAHCEPSGAGPAIDRVQVAPTVRAETTSRLTAELADYRRPLRAAEHHPIVVTTENTTVTNTFHDTQLRCVAIVSIVSRHSITTTYSSKQTHALRRQPGQEDHLESSSLSIPYLPISYPKTVKIDLISTMVMVRPMCT